LKLVDEKKNLKRISDLRGIRKQMAVFSTAEESIKSDITKRKQLQDEISSSTQTPEAKALSEEYNKIRDEMTKLKSENDDAYAKRGELRTQREELQKQRDKAYENKKAVQDEYYKQRDAYRLWNDQNRKVTPLSSLMWIVLTSRRKVKNIGRQERKRRKHDWNIMHPSDSKKLPKKLSQHKSGNVTMYPPSTPYSYDGG
jgi:chromosome segregation ATPase